MAHAHSIVPGVRLHRRRYASCPFVPYCTVPSTTQRLGQTVRKGLWLHAKGWKARWFGCHVPQVRVQPGYRRNHSLQFHHRCIPLLPLSFWHRATGRQSSHALTHRLRGPPLSSQLLGGYYTIGTLLQYRTSATVGRACRKSFV